MDFDYFYSFVYLKCLGIFVFDFEDIIFEDVKKECFSKV